MTGVFKAVTCATDSETVGQRFDMESAEVEGPEVVSEAACSTLAEARAEIGKLRAEVQALNEERSSMFSTQE